MADVSFAHVSAEGFTAFSAQLDEGAWGSMDVSNYVGADGRLLKGIAEAPALVWFKAQLLVSIQEVITVVQSTSDAKACNEAWDNAQKRFSGSIAVARASTNTQEKAAAERLHGLLLLGQSGVRQTRLEYQQQVDFGRKQMRLAAEAQCAADIALLGLNAMVAQIMSTTENLAAATGRGRLDLVPSKQRRAALGACMQVFGTVYRSLDWLANHSEAGADRDMAIALRAPLQALALRYQARMSKTVLEPSDVVAAPPSH